MSAQQAPRATTPFERILLAPVGARARWDELLDALAARPSDGESAWGCWPDWEGTCPSVYQKFALGPAVSCWRLGEDDVWVRVESPASLS